MKTKQLDLYQLTMKLKQLKDSYLRLNTTSLEKFLLSEIGSDSGEMKDFNKATEIQEELYRYAITTLEMEINSRQ